MSLTSAIEDCTLAMPSTPAERAQVSDQSSDTSAVATLVETYSPLLFRVAHSLLRSPSEAEDVVQDTFVRVLEHRKRLPEVRDLRVWLVRIAWNLALDRKRRIRPDQMDPSFARQLAAASVPADRALAEANHIAQILTEIDRLPAKERGILLLSAMDELSIPEIAQILAKSESATRALLFRARARLRERLQPQAKKGA